MIIYNTILAKIINYIFPEHIIYKNNIQTYCLHMAGKYAWEKRLVRIIGLKN